MQVTISEASLLLREAFSHKVGPQTTECIFLNLLWEFRKKEKNGKESKES
jgi:hypothetical protein